jgi:hypothetical protein
MSTRTIRTTIIGVATLAACSGGGTADDDAGAMVGVDATTDTAPAAVTYQDVKPIFVAKCTPCHLPGGEGAPFHTLADSYQTANNPAGNCPGKKIGECTIILVKSGYMPLNKGCSGDPTKDATNAACLTAAEQQRLEAWVAGGLREK